MEPTVMKYDRSSVVEIRNPIREAIQSLLFFLTIPIKIKANNRIGILSIKLKTIMVYLYYVINIHNI